jgi:hypothetical protein
MNSFIILVQFMGTFSNFFHDILVAVLIWATRISVCNIVIINKQVHYFSLVYFQKDQVEEEA